MAIKYNAMAIAISESWLEESFLNAEINIDGFTIYRADRNDRMRGGVCMYVKN